MFTQNRCNRDPRGSTLVQGESVSMIHSDPSGSVGGGSWQGGALSEPFSGGFVTLQSGCSRKAEPACSLSVHARWRRQRALVRYRVAGGLRSTFSTHAPVDRSFRSCGVIPWP